MASIYRNGVLYCGMAPIINAESVMSYLDSSTYLNTQASLRKILANLATVESDQSSKAYSVGDFLVLHGQVYEVTNSIEQDDTITPGTNVRVATIMDAITDYDGANYDDDITQAQIDAIIQ